MKLAIGDELLNVIEQVATLEWRKFQARTVKIELKNGGAIQEDHTLLPPYTSFRFESEDNALISKLQSAIQSYKGVVEWRMTGHERHTMHGINWVIRPAFVDEMQAAADASGAPSVGQYIAEHYPAFGPAAFEDLLLLTDYVRQRLS